MSFRESRPGTIHTGFPMFSIEERTRFALCTPLAPWHDPANRLYTRWAHNVRHSCLESLLEDQAMEVVPGSPNKPHFVRERLLLSRSGNL